MYYTDNSINKNLITEKKKETMPIIIVVGMVIVLSAATVAHLSLGLPVALC